MSQFQEYFGENLGRNQVSIVTIGYSTFTMPSNIIAELVTAAAHGQIRDVEKRYNAGTNQYEATIKAPVTVTGEFLKRKIDNQPEIEKLEARIKELKGE